MAHEAVWVQVTIPEDKTEEFLKVRAATAAAGHLCFRAQRISSVMPRHCSDTLPHRDGTPALPQRSCHVTATPALRCR